MRAALRSIVEGLGRGAGRWFESGEGGSREKEVEAKRGGVEE